MLIAMTALIGMRRIVTAKPAMTDGPSICQSRYRATQICSGEDQRVLMYMQKSMHRWASTDIRLTISPTVVLWRAELDSKRD